MTTETTNTATETTNTATTFSAALARFVARAQAIVDAHYAASYPNLTPSKLTIDPRGRKFVRIVVTSDGGHGQRSVYCFVDSTNGNVLKSESWKKPAKHARGNIFNVDGGTDAITPYGAKYLG